MNSGPRDSSGRSGGHGDDPTLPETHRDTTAPVLLAEPLDAEEVLEAETPEEVTPFSVRMDAWRRHYLPLPDEVVHEYLGEDEYVVHTDHPSFRAFLLKNGFQVLGLGVVGLLFLIFVRGGFDWWTILVFLALQLILAFLALKRLSDRYTSYVITNTRLIRLSGIFGRKLASIPWTRMTGLGYRQKPMGRVLGYATIFIESANEESGLREFSDINDPAAFHQKILDMVSAKSGQSSREPPPATRGERKGFLQRRRERRAVSLQRAKRQAVEAREELKARPGKGKPATKPEPLADDVIDTDTDTVIDTDTDAEVDADAGPSADARLQAETQARPRRRQPQPWADPDYEVHEDEPQRRPTLSSRADATEEMKAGSPPPGGTARPARLWPGAGTEPKPQRTPTRPKPGAAPRRPTPPRGTPATPPRTRTPPRGTPVPPRVVEKPGEDVQDRKIGGPSPWSKVRSRVSSLREAARRKGKPPESGPGTSARDALASVRRTQRSSSTVRPARRTRLPNIGRRPRQSFPESRQLPAASESPDDEPDDD